MSKSNKRKAEKKEKYQIVTNPFKKLKKLKIDFLYSL